VPSQSFRLPILCVGCYDTRRAIGVVLLLLSSVVASCSGAPITAGAPRAAIACKSCEEWNTSREPFRVFGNTYYVGPSGLSSILVTSEAGHILFDGALPQSAPLIEANIRALGFRLEDVRVIAVSHEHFDHAGGIAALQAASKAAVVASPPAVRAMREGWPLDSDPQYALMSEAARYPPVPEVRTIADGEVLRVGTVEVTAHLTPGHSPGSTTWTWRSCEEPRCLDIVYADSLSAVSAPDFSFTRQPGGVETFRRSIERIHNLACDVLLTVHPGFADIDEKFRARTRDPESNPFVDSGACRDYADGAAEALDRRIAEENRQIGAAVPGLAVEGGDAEAGHRD